MVGDDELALILSPMKIVRADDELIVIESGDQSAGSTKLLMFDLDSTLIFFDTANKHISWSYEYPEVPAKLREMSIDGYFIAIASNQSTLVKEGLVETFIEKICSFMADLALPVVFMAALKKNKYRKPCNGMYEYLCERYVDEKQLVEKTYIGDAAGYRSGARFMSDCDIKFAYNSGMSFKVPEEFFLGKEIKCSLEPFEIEKHRGPDLDIDRSKSIVFVYGKKQRCGKRFFIEKYFPEHRIVGERESRIEKVVLVNCNNLTFIESVMKRCPNNVSIFYLDYPPRVVGHLKVLADLCEENIAVFSVIYDKTLAFVEKHGIKVPFVYDDSDYPPAKLRISKMQL
jgi:bifunctional polynucleotide phosphatase/kinase